MKGIALISAVIFLAFTIIAVGIVYQAGAPLVAKMQAAASIEKMKEALSELDRMILEVASEGKGSKRTVYFDVDPGTLYVNGTQNVIYWVFETTALVISPRTSQKFGNLIIGSNLETSGYEGTHGGDDAYILENEHLKVFIKKIGSPSSHASYNTTDLLLAVFQKDLNVYMDLQSLNISIDDAGSSTAGSGYTYLQNGGSNLPYASVIAFMNSSYVDYYVNFTLQSGTDFLEIEASVYG
jgi:hypothetical protein